MNLFDGLQLLEQIKDGEVKSYLAADPPRGRNLLVHWISVDAGSEVRELLELVDGLPSAGRFLILEAGIRDGRIYLITENPPQFPGLKEWLLSAGRSLAAAGQAQVPERTAEMPIPETAGAQPEQSAPVPVAAGVPVTTSVAPVNAPPASSPAPAPGEFTRLFEAPTFPAAQLPVVTPVVPPPAAPPATFQPPPVQAPTAPPPVSQPASAQPGEFTRLFARPEAPPAPPPLVQPVQSPQPVPSSQPPGEFTRVFQAGSLQALGAQGLGPQAPATPTVPVPKPAPPKTEPGEFTQFFQSPGQPKAPAPPASIPGKPADHDFTKFLQSPLATPTPSTANDDYFSKPEVKAPAGQGAGEFTQIFGRPGGPPEAPQSREATGVFSKPPAAQLGQGPSEFTRILGPQSVPAAPEPAPAPPKPVAAKPAPAAQKNLLPLILILAVLAVLALVLVFLFIRK